MIEEKLNEEDIKKFYEFIDHEKQSELRLIKNGEIIQKWVSNVDDFIKEISKYNGKYEIYVGINERENNGDKDENVKFITNIGHDIDAHDGSQESLLKAQETALKIQSDCVEKGMEKPLLLCSGRGFWVVHHISPIENTFENVKKIKEFGKWLKEKYEVDGIELDSTVYNPSRIARVPGTINTKTENKILAFIAGDYSLKEDEKLKDKILGIEIKQTNLNVGAVIPKDSCAFMDYCLSHEIPKGERHKVISRNMALYISKHPDRELLREQYIKIQKGSQQELDGWLKNIDINGKEKYPFSCGEIIKFQKKYKIPLKCKGCPKYSEYRKDKLAEKKLQKALEIEERKDYTELQKDVFQEILVKDFGKASELLVNEIEDNNFIYSTKDDLKSEMWIYEEGIYIPNGKSFVKSFCRNILGEAHSQFIVNLVINKIEADTFIEQDEFFKNNYVEELPVKNGVLNVKTRKLSNFDPKKIFFNKLPVEYDEEAECPNIDKFFKDILSNEEDRNVAYELIGSGLYKDYFTEKAGMLVGSGRNGKGKFLELVKRLIGIENSSSVPIRAMKEDNSSLCELHGKLFNLAGDLSGGDLKDTGVFKQTVGRDLLQAHRKFLKDLIFVNYAKHIFACNELPRVFDTTDGFWTKWVLLEFPYKFISEEELKKLPQGERKNKKIRDQQIIEKISNDEELSGLLNKALDGLDRLFKQKDFSQTKGTKDIRDLWIRKSDSFTAFCIDSIQEDFKGYITKKALRKKFFMYCKQHKIKGAGDKDIKVILQDRYGAIEGRKTIEDSQEYIWEGIEFKGGIIFS